MEKAGVARRHWLYRLAVRGCLTAGVLVAFDAAALSPHGEHYERREILTAGDDGQAPSKPAALSVVCTDNPKANNNPDEREQHGQGHPGPNSDLCQQWRMAESAEDMADWSLGQLWVTGFEAFLVLLATGAAFSAAYWAKRAAFAGNEAVRVTDDIAKRQLRAYMSIAPGPIKMGDSLFIKISQKNCGQTPATDVRFFAEAKIMNLDHASEPDFPVIEKEPGVNAVQPGHAFSVTIPVPGTKTIRGAGGKEARFDYHRRLIANAPAGECVYVFAELTYSDIYEREHGTRACWRYEFAGKDLKAMNDGWFNSEFFYTEGNNYIYDIKHHAQRMARESWAQRARRTIGGWIAGRPA